MDYEIKDITIIGGGPTGLFALFYAGMRGASAQIVDALPEAGGQLAALYPEKHIYDVGGHPRILAKDLVRSLVEQAGQFAEPVHLARQIDSLTGEPRSFVLRSGEDTFRSRAIVIAAGLGAFEPRRLPQKVAHPWYGRGVYDKVLDPLLFAGRKVLIIGGGDSAFDWAQQLIARGSAVTLAHRSDRFRAHAATVADVSASVAAGKAQLYTFHELQDVHSEGEAISAVTLRDVRDESTRRVEAEVVLPMLGFVSHMGVIREWGLNFEKNKIRVNSLMETGREGIYAAGDVTTFPGKLNLIASGFGEAATAVNQAVHWIYPEKKIDPGHSSNMAIFGETDD